MRTLRIAERLGGREWPLRRRTPKRSSALGPRSSTHSLMALYPRMPHSVAALASASTVASAWRRPLAAAGVVDAVEERGQGTHLGGAEHHLRGSMAQVRVEMHRHAAGSARCATARRRTPASGTRVRGSCSPGAGGESRGSVRPRPSSRLGRRCRGNAPGRRRSRRAAAHGRSAPANHARDGACTPRPGAGRNPCGSHLTQERSST